MEKFTIEEILAERESIRRYEPSETGLTPSAYILLGGTGGDGAKPVAEGNEGIIFLCDGATEVVIRPADKDRVYIVETPQRLYRDYMPVVRQMPERYFSEAADILKFAVGSDARGGSMTPLYGRLAFTDPDVLEKARRAADSLVVMLDDARQGRLAGATIHYVSSLCGGMGGPIVLDTRKIVNAALAAYGGRNIHNALWLLGHRAFHKHEAGRPERLTNHVARTLEIVSDFMVVGEEEMHVFDFVFMLDLPATSEEVRYTSIASALRVTNPRPWDLFMDRLTNYVATMKPKEKWLKQFLHFAGGNLPGMHVSISDVMAYVGMKLGETRVERVGPENLSWTPDIKTTHTEPSVISNVVIQGHVAQGNLERILTLMAIQDVTSTAEIKFSLGGAPVDIEGLLTLRSATTASKVTVRLATLKRLERELATYHGTMRTKRQEALTQLNQRNEEGSMGKLHSLVRGFTPRPRRSLIRTIVGQAADAFAESVTKKLEQAPPAVRDLVRQINATKTFLAETEAMLAVLESPEVPEQSLMRRIQAARQRFERTGMRSRRALATISTASASVHPAAKMLVTDDLLQVVDELIRRGRPHSDVQAAVREYLNGRQLSLDQLAVLCGCQPEKREVVDAITKAYTLARANDRYWTTPVLRPHIERILVPNTDEGLVMDLQREMESVLPGVSLWIDPEGDGLTIALGYVVCHGVHGRNEVMPPGWKAVVDILRNEPDERAQRAFKDRFFPEPFRLDGQGEG